MRYFDTTEKQEDIINIGNSLSRYLFINQIKNIMFLDCSARPVYLALNGSWKKRYPNIPHPQVYFTNPDGYTNRRFERIEDEFNNIYKKLALDKKVKIMLFDVCMHEGRAMGPVFNFFKNTGYENVIVGLAQPKDLEFTTNIPVEFTALNYTPARNCRVFDQDLTVTREEHKMLCSREDGEFQRNDCIQIRNEISDLFISC